MSELSQPGCGRVCVSAPRDGRVSSPRWGPTSQAPRAARIGPATLDPKLECVGWKIIILLAFINLSYMYI